MRKEMQAAFTWLRQNDVDFADIRINDIMEEHFTVENTEIKDYSIENTNGYGIRVYYQGALGFAACEDFERVLETAEKALALAKASKLVQRQAIKLAPRTPVRDHYATSVEIDPFEVSLADKIQLLLAAEAEMLRQEPGLRKTQASMDFRREEKTYMDIEGSYITQVLTESGAGIQAVAANELETQSRSYPCSRGKFATAGYEFVEGLRLVENAAKTAQEAVALLSAPQCPSGYFDLVIDSTQMTLQIHESVGHAIELDRVMGHEAGFFGTSFIKPETLGSFMYGSEHVNIVADATTPGGLGSFGYDDDGIKAQCIPIITKGILKNLLTSRDTAGLINVAANGTSRADGWRRTPLVRMTNISLLPGDMELEELFADIEYGFYLLNNKSWSIDDKRLNFQFGSEIAYEIANGKLTGKIFKNPVYTGITPQFWRSCDGVANKKYWQLFGTPNCGKAEPDQTAHVGHGSSPARFRSVKVGVDND